MVVIKLEEKIVIKALYSGKSSCIYIDILELENLYIKKLLLKRVTFHNGALLEYHLLFP